MCFQKQVAGEDVCYENTFITLIAFIDSVLHCALLRAFIVHNFVCKFCADLQNLKTKNFLSQKGPLNGYIGREENGR